MNALIKSGYSPTGMITLFEHFMAEEYKQPLVDYGRYMNHPTTPKRLAAAVKILHDRNIPIERKYSLGLLRTEIREGSKDISLNIDGHNVITGMKSPDSRALIASIRSEIDRYLQLELAPYEIHVERGSLYIGNHFIAGNSDGMTKPDDIRRNLLRVINSARAKYPTSKFFK